MGSSERRALDRAAEQEQLLSSLLVERDGLLAVLDRVLALGGTARLIRDAAGADAGFVADIESPDRAVIRWLAGNRTSGLQDLVVPRGQGVGGRVLATGAPVRVPDYVTSSTITHHFDGIVRQEAMGAMLAVPILDRGRTVAVAYAALRGEGQFGDDAVVAMERVATDAARALRLAERAAADRETAVAAERARMQASLHDSVGAMLFSIGAQVRDLKALLPDNPVLASRLGRLELDVSAAARALREALLSLSGTTPERALPIELAEHCRSFEARTGVPCRFVQLGEVEPLDQERTSLLIAAVREGLLNVEKHAEASTVVVSLGEHDDGVGVAVADDGQVREPGEPNGTGLGVRMLAEKAARLGGRVSLVHDEDGGTTLRMVLPTPRTGQRENG
ncbi:Signal transduction histidine kinase [Pseudonocardia thermophila]|uniref:Oxygen sensor histidine kinase NreB n=1 Tax=Pseudonocardia thermophila TaxID=1848 RepID=A0A1M6RSV2_PSETH|nr:GAF domain-containing protein [Pseudonocardia thermophila]SHK35515.1 Signal transduction histidine kinase [Pseudonocardia thermophila]